MKTITFFLIFSLFFIKVNAQYTIPGATQQPAWVFPLWFENAFGEKDTVYIGYDANANSPIQNDTVFGEKLIKIDTSKFNMEFCGSLFPDSLYKTKVSYDFNPALSCGDGSFEIYGASNAWLPLKMSWDVNLFRSDSLPFPDQDPAPRAQGLVWFQGDASDGSGICMSPGDPLLATDTTVAGGGNAICIRKDSVVFTQLSNLYIHVRPWQGLYLSVEENQKSAFRVQLYPNPFSYAATIKITGNELQTTNYELKIYNILGNLVLKSKITQQQFEIKRGNLPEGVYFYEITMQKTQPVRGKFIIQ